MSSPTGRNFSMPKATPERINIIASARNGFLIGAISSYLRSFDSSRIRGLQSSDRQHTQQSSLSPKPALAREGRQEFLNGKSRTLIIADCDNLSQMVMQLPLTIIVIGDQCQRRQVVAKERVRYAARRLRLDTNLP